MWLVAICSPKTGKIVVIERRHLYQHLNYCDSLIFSIFCVSVRISDKTIVPRSTLTTVARRQNLMDTAPETRLFLAAQSGQLDDVRSLLASSVNPNVKTAGVTPLVAAAENGHLEVCQALLKSGADPKLVGAEARSAYSLATKKGHDEVAMLLASVSIAHSLVVSERVLLYSVAVSERFLCLLCSPACSLRQPAAK